MVTRLYLNNSVAGATPAAFRGAWNDTASAVTKDVATSKVASSITSISVAEVSATNPYAVCLYRGVSAPIDAQTVDGTVNLNVLVDESSASADMAYALHIYVMAPDGSVRGTLLTDYLDASGNEWVSNFGTGGTRALNAAQTLTSVATTAGDRIVVELGYVARNSVTTSFTGKLFYGGTLYNQDATGTGLTSQSTPPPFSWIEFSDTVAFEAVGDLRVSQVVAEVAYTHDAPDTRVSQVVAETIIRYPTPTVQVSQVVVEVLLKQSVVTAVGRSQVVIAG